VSDELRVLWYVDVPPGPLAERTGQAVAAGPMSWAESLREALSRTSGVKLGIVSTAPAPCDPFEEDGVTYFSVPGQRATGRWASAWSRWSHPPVLEHDLTATTAAVRSFAPSVVHVHGTEGPFGLLASMIAVPCVMSLQGLLVVYTRFWLQGISPREYGRLVFSREFLRGGGLLHGHVELKRRAERERLILASGSDFIGRTEWDRRVLLGANPGARYWHCDEVLRTPFYSSEWREHTQPGFVVYSTGSDMPFKGTECLIESIAILSRTGMTDVRLRVAGVRSGSELEAMYYRLAARHHISDRVELLGRLDAPQLVDELLACHVYVHPSRIDNSPNSLAEAMLLGVPCIAAFAGGIPSMMCDGVSGILVPPGDPYAIAGAVRDMRCDREAAAALGRAARATAQTRHDPTRIAERMTAIYDGVSRGQVHTLGAVS
jgi:glycosyltransferase involved in cell wall biosynthesis